LLLGDTSELGDRGAEHGVVESLGFIGGAYHNLSKLVSLLHYSLKLFVLVPTFSTYVSCFSPPASKRKDIEGWRHRRHYKAPSHIQASTWFTIRPTKRTNACVLQTQCRHNLTDVINHPVISCYDSPSFTSPQTALCSGSDILCRAFFGASHPASRTTLFQVLGLLERLESPDCRLSIQMYMLISAKESH
jgi:hypothetical protein